MIKPLLNGLLTLAMVTLPGAARAQAEPAPAAPAAPAATATQCVLHVWPGRAFHSVYYGWAHGGTIDGAQKGRKGYPPLPDEPLSVEIQLAELRKIDIPAALGLSGYRTVLHDAPLDVKALRGATGRQLAESGPCYAELMIDNMVFQNNVLSGRWLNVIYRFRQFEGDAPGPVRSYGTYVLARTTLFPPDAETDPQPALAELRAAFAQTVTGFGLEYAKHLKRAGKRKGAPNT